MLFCLRSYTTELLLFTTCISILQRLVDITHLEKFSWRAELLNTTEIFSTLCFLLSSNLSRLFIVTSSLSLLRDWISWGRLFLLISLLELPVLSSLSLRAEEEPLVTFLQYEDLNASSLSQFTTLLQSLLQQRRFMSDS